MKNLKQPAVILNLILIIILAYLLFQNDQKPEIEDSDQIPDEELLAQVREQILPNEKVFELFHNYDEKENVINEFIRGRYQRENFNDTRTVYFDFNVLQAYLRLVERISKDKKIVPEGIKVIIGADGSKGNNPYQTNVIFVPTTKNQGRQSAYTTRGGEIVFFKNIKPKDSTANETTQRGGFLTLKMSIQDDGLGLNGGRPIPPPNNDDPDFD